MYFSQPFKKVLYTFSKNAKNLCNKENYYILFLLTLYYYRNLYEGLILKSSLLFFVYIFISTACSLVQTSCENHLELPRIKEEKYLPDNIMYSTWSKTKCTLCITEIQVLNKRYPCNMDLVRKF